MPVLDCVWPIDPADCCPPLDESPAESPADADRIEQIIAKVSDMMTRWSGYRIGVCAAELRPLGPCSTCRSWCCGGADGIRLQGPNGMYVTSVTNVHVGGATLDPELWRFDIEKQTLWRTPPGRFPGRDSRWAECGEAGTFCVDAVVGEEPDSWALDVAATLVCELVRACRGDKKCRIPKNATQVTAQGVTITLRDSDINNLLPEVTGWIAAVNPASAVLPGRVWSPDLVVPGHTGNGLGPNGLFVSVRGGGCCGS